MTIPPTEETPGPKGPEKAPEFEKEVKWFGHLFRKEKGEKSAKIFPKEGGEPLAEAKRRFSVGNFCGKIRSIAQRICQFFRKKPSEEEIFDFIKNPRAAFGQMVDKDVDLSLFGYLENEAPAEDYLLDVIGDRRLNKKLREEQLSLEKNNKKLPPGDQVLLQMSYLTNEDFKKAGEAIVKFNDAFKNLNLEPFLEKSKELLNGQEEIFSALGKRVNMEHQTDAERLFSEEMVSLYEQLKENSELENPALENQLRAHLKAYDELQTLKGKYDERLLKEYTAPLTMADVRQIEKVKKLASLIPLEGEGIDEALEKLFLNQDLRDTFKTVLEASQIWKTLSDLLCALPGYRSGDVLFDQQDKIWAYTGRRGVPLSLQNKISPRTWLRVIKALLEGRAEVHGFFVGKDVHAALVQVQEEGSLGIQEIIEGLQLSGVTIREALCSDAFRLNLSSIIGEENIEKLKAEGIADPESYLQRKYQDGLVLCMQRKGFLKTVRFASQRAVGALMRKGPKSAKKDQRIEWQSIPESADERQNMICSEFVARAQDAVFLWMNDFFEQHFPDLQQPLFPSLVSSEKDYSLIYPKRLKGLIEAQGYVKLETPLAAKLFVQEAPKVP